MLDAKRYNTVIKEIIEESPTTKIFRLWFPEISEFTFKAGQFVMVWDEEFKNEKGIPIKRAYSITSSPSEKRFIELCVKKSGNMALSDRFMNYKIGKAIGVEGPFGKFIIPDNIKNAMFIAGGTGIAPLICMIRDLQSNKFKGKIYLLYSFKCPEEFLYKEEITKLETHDNANVLLFVTENMASEWKGNIGRINFETLKKQINHDDMDFFICGPFDFVSSITRDLENLNFKSEKVHKEAWQS